MGRAGFEPTKAKPPDLQSGPVNHLGIDPVRLFEIKKFRQEPSLSQHNLFKKSNNLNQPFNVNLVVVPPGFEPGTH